ncbi:MAG: hypothetical protein RJA22_792 [Verrucomicrobiota bacterium]|jgi:uncharacterized protein Yka (UPF0111/DUF47 family)
MSTIPLQKLLGKEDRFFDLLEASATEACASVRALREFIRNPGPGALLDPLIQCRVKNKGIIGQINEALCTSFVSAIEAEDIEALSNSLYKIPKTVEKIAERIHLAPEHLAGIDLGPQLALVEQAAEALRRMVGELRKGISLAGIKVHNEQLHAAEGDMDKALNELVRGLYHATEHPGRVLFLKDLYELLERVTDRCRDAGNIIARIVLKGS